MGAKPRRDAGGAGGAGGASARLGARRKGAAGQRRLAASSAARATCAPASGEAATGHSSQTGANAARSEQGQQQRPADPTLRVATRARRVNLRAGPGERYQIEWVYQRRDLPVEIEREFDIWRLIRDADGVRGWVQEVMVMGRRDFVVTAADRTLRHDPDDKSSAVAILNVGVIGRIRSCAAKADWCQVQVDDYRGWLRRDEFWGTLPGEAVGN